MAKALPFLLGPPTHGYLGVSSKAGYFLGAACATLGAMVLFAAECGAAQKSSSSSNNAKDKSHNMVSGSASNASSTAGGGGSSHHSILKKEGSSLIVAGDSASNQRGGGGSNVMVLQDFATASRGAVSAGPIMGAGHSVRCTCGDDEHSVVSRNRKLSWSGDAVDQQHPVPSEPDAIAVQDEVLRHLQQQTTNFNGTVVTIPESYLIPDQPHDHDDDDDEDDDNDLVLNGVIKPELLTCISEENLFENLDLELLFANANSNVECYASDDHRHAGFRLLPNRLPRILSEDEEEEEEEEEEENHNQIHVRSPRHRLLRGHKGHSFSEPDLSRLLLQTPSPPPPPHLLVKGLKSPGDKVAELSPSGVPSEAPLNRQRTWHAFKSPVIPLIFRRSFRKKEEVGEREGEKKKNSGANKDERGSFGQDDKKKKKSKKTKIPISSSSAASDRASFV